MIQLPRRSVTRFFIPLIDVLTLLFCIFLLMPVMKQASDAEAREAKPDSPIDRAAWEKDRRELAWLKIELSKPIAERLYVKVLEIDGKTGKLYFRDGERQEIATSAQAKDLIARHQQEAGSLQVYYLFLYPYRERGQPVAGFPSGKQFALYNEWFVDVPHDFDMPGKKPKRAKP